jgi:hypothetical protein
MKGTALVPVAAGTGPCAFTPEGAPASFSRSRAGSVFAAQWFAGVLNVTGARPGWKERIASSVLDGPGRAVMAAAAQRVQDHQDPAPGPGNSTIQTCGYRLVSWTKDAAVVELVVCPLSSVNGSPVVLSVSLAWSAGDWKVVPTLEGRLLDRDMNRTSFDGFIPWGSETYRGLYAGAGKQGGS